MRTQSTTDSDTMSFRGASLDEAVALAEESLGAPVRVVAANRIRRGGIGGFFASDLGVEVSVSLDDESIEQALERLVSETAADERTRWMEHRDRDQHAPMSTRDAGAERPWRRRASWQRPMRRAATVWPPRRPSRPCPHRRWQGRSQGPAPCALPSATLRRRWCRSLRSSTSWHTSPPGPSLRTTPSLQPSPRSLFRRRSPCRRHRGAAHVAAPRQRGRSRRIGERRGVAGAGRGRRARSGRRGIVQQRSRPCRSGRCSPGCRRPMRHPTPRATRRISSSSSSTTRSTSQPTASAIAAPSQRQVELAVAAADQLIESLQRETGVKRDVGEGRAAHR